MNTPWERAQERRYVTQEKRTAKKPGARAQLNSGRTWRALRDVIENSPLGKVLTDNKTTEAASYRIEKGDWHSLERDANRTPPGCLPSLQIDIQDVRLRLIGEDTWDEINKLFTILIARLTELEAQIGENDRASTSG